MKSWKSPYGDEGTLYSSTDELFSVQIREPFWAIPGLLPANGLTLLAGRPESGKSCLAILMALGITSGVQVLGYGPPDQLGRVLYVQADTYLAEWQIQVKAITTTVLGSPVALPFATLTMPKNWLGIGYTLAWIKEAVQTVKPTLVVWDSLNSTNGHQDLNTLGGVTHVLNQLDKLACGAAQLLLCHLNKNPEQTGLYQIAYHHSLKSRARAHLVLRDKEDGEGARLFISTHTTKQVDLSVVNHEMVWRLAPKKVPPTGKGVAAAGNAW